MDLKDIKVVTKLGGTVDDSEMVDGMVFDHKAAKSAGGPTRIENAKIGLIQFQISPPKTDLENNVIISDYAQMDRILKEERNYILQMIKKIRATGCNVLLIQKSILRDAVTELSLHYLVRLHITILHALVLHVALRLECLGHAGWSHLLSLQQNPLAGRQQQDILRMMHSYLHWYLRLGNAFSNPTEAMAEQGNVCRPKQRSWW